MRSPNASRLALRIEDEVVMTDHGYRLLTGSIPRKLEDVESSARKTGRLVEGRGKT